MVVELKEALSWEGKLIAECTREELVACINFLAERVETLVAERRERAMAGIVAGG